MSGAITASSFAAGWGTSSIGPDASVEQRVKALENNLAQLTSHFRIELEQTRKGFEKIAAELQEETQARTTGQKNIHERLKEVQTSGFGMASIGLVWVAFGSFLSTTSAELATRTLHLLG